MKDRKMDCRDKRLVTGALHGKPQTLDMIARNRDIYLVGLKKNQRELFHRMEAVTDEVCDNLTVD